MENGSSENESFIKLTYKMCLYYRNSDTSYVKAVTSKKVENKRIFFCLEHEVIECWARRPEKQRRYR